MKGHLHSVVVGLWIYIHLLDKNKLQINFVLANDSQ